MGLLCCARFTRASSTFAGEVSPAGAIAVVVVVEVVVAVAVAVPSCCGCYSSERHRHRHWPCHCHCWGVTLLLILCSEPPFRLSPILFPVPNSESLISQTPL